MALARLYAAVKPVDIIDEILIADIVGVGLGERRALSRRKFAVRAFDEARRALAIAIIECTIANFGKKKPNWLNVFKGSL